LPAMKRAASATPTMAKARSRVGSGMMSFLRG